MTRTRYENREFGVAVDFPEGWRLSYWGSRKRPYKGKNSNKFQSTYDDYPSKEHQEKQLFFSSLFTKGSLAFYSCQFAIYAIYSPFNYDLNEGFKLAAGEIKRTFGDIQIQDIECRYVYQEIDYQKYILYRKFIYFKLKKDIWLCCLVEGDTIENFKRSKRVLNRLKVNLGEF